MGQAVMAKGLTRDAILKLIGQQGFQTEAQVRTILNSIVGAAPDTMNTLVELAAALNNDPDFAKNMKDLINTKASTAEVNKLLEKKSNIGHNHNANEVTFNDGDTFQQKYDSGELHGEAGAAAGFGRPTVNIDNTVGTPSASISTEGPNTSKIFHFQFNALKGVKGDKGEQGIQGIQGSQGPIGKQGIQGPKGEIGAQGPAGPMGIAGPKGEPGPRGQQGIQGERGLKGDTGPQGIVGPQGIQGPVGPQGVPGPKGDIGPKGDSGIQTTIDGMFNLIVESDGNLYVVSNDGVMTGENWELDENKNLYYVIKG